MLDDSCESFSSLGREPLTYATYDCVCLGGCRSVSVRWVCWAPSSNIKYKYNHGEQGRRRDDLVIAQHDAEALTFNTTISVVAREEQHHPTNINISTVLNEVLFLRASKKERTAASEWFERAETERQQHSRLRSDKRYAEWRRIYAVYCLM